MGLKRDGAVKELGGNTEDPVMAGSTVAMQSPAGAPEYVTRTLRLKVRPESYRWLNAAASEVNLVWNYFNEISAKAARPYVGRGKWLSGFELCALSARAAPFFERIGGDTIQRIAIEYATRRRQCKKVKLRWRVSRGARRSLGWVPLKAASLKRKGKALRFCGKTFRTFEPERLEGVKWQQGCFAQDAVGDWWLCLPVQIPIEPTVAPEDAVGIDLGLRHTAVTSAGERLDAGNFYGILEQKIAQAQRRGHWRQAKRLHRRAANRRRNALHQFSRRIVDRYQMIIVGDVSSTQLVKTRLSKSVLDAGWGALRQMLLYKGEHAGRSVQIVNERFTTRACSSCGQLTGPSGLRQLAVRRWSCSVCEAEHDRDVNAARNILRRAQVRTSVGGNESSSSQVQPSSASCAREARMNP